MKKYLYIFAIIGYFFSTTAQVGIGNTNPEGILDITSTTHGVLLPRVALTNLSIAAPILNPQTGSIATSTLVFHDGSNSIDVGFYYWSGAKWIILQSGDTNSWDLVGNYGTNPSINFLGTLGPEDLVIRTSNVEHIRVLSSGEVGIGTSSPSTVLHASGSKANLPILYVSQTSTNLGSHAIKGEGTYGPTAGYLGVIGNTAFDGSTWDISGREIGVLGISEGSTATDNVGVMGLSNGVGVMGGSISDIGVFGFSSANHGMYSSTSGANVQGLFTYNYNTLGSGILGVGNNTTGQYIVSGSGGAFTGTTTGMVSLAKTDLTGNGIISAGCNMGWWTLNYGSGVAGTGVFGVYGRSESSNGAGVIGQNTSTGWTGDFQGPMRAGITTADRHDFYGWWQSGSNSDSHRVNPNSGNWGYVGDATYYWYYMYANNYINVSRRETKRDIQPISKNSNFEEVLMSDLDKIEPSFYKYKCESDQFLIGNEAKFRPNKHLGIILDESPDYLKDNTLSGIDLYAVSVMALAATKYNRKQIQKRAKKISDFGVGNINKSTVYVSFSDEFKLENKTKIPVVTVTALAANARLHVKEVSNDGFTVVSENVKALSFNWIAMAHIAPTTKEKTHDIEAYKLANELSVSKTDKEQMKQWMASEKAYIDQIKKTRTPATLTEAVSHKRLNTNISQKRVTSSIKE